MGVPGPSLLIESTDYDNHTDAHNNRNYISEAIVPVEFNGALAKCCLVPAMGNSEVQCCSTVVNIGMYTLSMIILTMIVLLL